MIDIICELESFGVDVSVYDPWADKKEVDQEYKIRLLEQLPDLQEFGGILVAVGHEEFKSLDLDGRIIYDVKGILPKESVTARL